MNLHLSGLSDAELLSKHGLVSVDAVCTIIGVTKDTMDGLLRMHLTPPVTLVGPRRYMNERLVMEWRDKRAAREAKQTTAAADRARTLADRKFKAFQR